MAALGTFIKYLSCLTEVGFPLEHYILELQDDRVACNWSLSKERAGLKTSSKVASLDERRAMVTAVQPGQTNLVFVHKSILFKF